MASLQGAVPPESAELRAQFLNAIDEGRLLSPPGDNAVELHQRYTALPIAPEQIEDADDDLVIALASAGDRVLWAYRRGDQVIPLDAARYEEGARLFGRAAQVAQDDIALESKARFMTGRALVENREFDDGIAVLRQAVALDPDAAYSYNALGIAYMEQQQWNDAIQNRRAASDRAENWVYPRFNLSRVYASLERYDDAERSCAPPSASRANATSSTLICITISAFFICIRASSRRPKNSSSAPSK